MTLEKKRNEREGAIKWILTSSERTNTVINQRTLKIFIKFTTINKSAVQTQTEHVKPYDRPERQQGRDRTEERRREETREAGEQERKSGQRVCDRHTHRPTDQTTGRYTPQMLCL